MKIRLDRLEDPDYDTAHCRWTESEYENDPLVEIPDAIVKDWRDTLAHLAELEKYFDEKATPQIETQNEERRKREAEEWERTATPEQKAFRKWRTEALMSAVECQLKWFEKRHAGMIQFDGTETKKDSEVVVYQQAHPIDIKSR
jgi:hypothetical protein